MNAKLVGTIFAVLLTALGGSAAADDRRGGEVGLLVGAIYPDEVMTRRSSSVEVTFGLRGGSVFGRHWGWYVDGLYSEIGANEAFGDARTVIGRTGLDYLFGPARDARWFVTAGGGWMAVDFEKAGFEDFHNPLASVGLGQRIRLGSNTRLRWELRADRTLDDARLDEELVQGHLLLGLVWGPAGTPGARRERRAAGDADADGVRDKRDHCPQTPAGAVVDGRGCALDDDRDGVPNGIDLCPQSRTREAIGPDGCPADGDGDGVRDITDVCAGTPAGARVDEWGCPTDGDLDSVYDGLDVCPDTPLGARVDPRGCPSDTDGDGVLDGLDRCPGTPPGTEVDTRGCAFDGDRDGVPDDRDACPDTPAGAPPVDERGCAREARLFEEGRTAVVLPGVSFETNSARLTTDSLRSLDRVARWLLEHAAARVEIGGHTDSTGDAGFNFRLSEQRAEAVRAYLVAQGVDADRLLARGYGETLPIADNSGAEGRAWNRRVELKLLQDDEPR